MKTWLVITDLTRMQGKRVCLAGYTADRTCVRPVFRKPLGLTEDWLQANKQGIIRPFAVVEFDLQENLPEPPHTEDWLISPVYRVKRVLAPKARRRCWTKSKMAAWKPYLGPRFMRNKAGTSRQAKAIAR